MTGPPAGEGSRSGQPVDGEDRVARNIGVGCFTTFIGLWSGGMIAVLIGKVVEGIRGAPSCDGLPLWNWNLYAAVGALIGAVTLPVLVLRRLRRRDVRPGTPSRG
jgi:hypothetical protein